MSRLRSSQKFHAYREEMYSFLVQEINEINHKFNTRALMTIRESELLLVVGCWVSRRGLTLVSITTFRNR